MTRHRPIWILALTLAAAACRPQAEPSSADPASLRATPAGPLVGAVGMYGDHVWRGIPYAQAPTGERRWRAPRPLPAWTETLQALASGSPCPQYPSAFGGVAGPADGVAGNEDCLFLNVFAPRFTADQVPRDTGRLPVMVWIHGGGNSIGEAGFVDGGRLATDERVIVVALNYRLGPLGWLRHAALREGATPAEQSGNFALLDLVRALEWVRDNIDAFGGDPGNVTIFGESAGGRNVFSLLLAPQAKGLFQRAIVQSGGLLTSDPAEAENAVDATPPGHVASSHEALLRLLQHDGAADRAAATAQLAAMSPAAIAAYLRGKPAAEFLGAYEPYRNNGMISMPQVFADGVVLPVGDPLRQFASADGWNRVPVMLGTNRDENRLFMFADPRWVTRYFWIVPRLRDEALYVATADLMARQWKATGADQPAAAMRGVEDDVYVYRFDWDEQPRMLGADLSTMLGAAHGFEIPFVFGHFNLGRQADVMWTDANSPGREQLSAAMMEYWVNFARTGRPGSAAGVEWLAWDPSSPTAPKYVVLDTPAGGGIRMAHDTQTVQGVLDSVASDPRLADARARCTVYHDLAQWARGLRRSDYDALAACKEYPFEEYPWS